MSLTDMELVLQPTKTLQMKLELYDTTYARENEITGDILSFTSKIDGGSHIRRTATATLYVSSAAYLASSFSKLWLNQMIRASLGILDRTTGETRWFLIGSFIISNNAYSYSAEKQELTLSLIDMMGAATPERGSQIGASVVVEEGNIVKNVLAATITRFSPYNRTDICDFPDVIPYDQEVNVAAYPIDVLSQILELFPTYEQFYTTDGVYTVRQVPTGIGEPVMLTAEQMHQIVISEDGDINYADVKNSTEIWGQVLDATYTATGCVSVGSQYQLSIDTDYTVLEDGSTFAFTPDATNVAGQTMKVGNSAAFAMYTQSGDGTYTPITTGAMQAEKQYVVKYAAERFVLLGESIIHVVWMEYNVQPDSNKIASLKTRFGCDNIRFTINPDSPFACDHISDNNGNPVGIIHQVFSDGDYANINSTELAYERASYENWKTTRLVDSIQLKCLYVPWLDVNQKIEYTSVATGETHQYMVQGIDIDIASFTMTLNLIRFYPYYPWAD